MGIERRLWLALNVVGYGAAQTRFRPRDRRPRALHTRHQRQQSGQDS